MRVVVLFNLKADVASSDFEDWVRTRDLPGVRALVSVSNYQVYHARHLLGASGEPPYRYVGIIDINDREGFDRDMATESARKLMAEFEGFADAPVSLVTEPLSEVRP